MIRADGFAPPLPLWERAARLGEAKPSLGERGEGAATYPDRSNPLVT